MNKMKITWRTATTDPKVALLQLEGIFNESAVGVLRELFVSLPETDLKVLVLNFEKVATLDAFGAGFIAGLLELTERSTCELRLVRVPANVRRTLLDVQPPVKNLRWYESEAEALAGAPAALPRPFLEKFVLATPVTEAVSGVPFRLRVEARDGNDHFYPAYQGTPHLAADHGLLSPTLLGPFVEGKWEGEIILTGPGPVKLRVWDEGGLGEATVQIVEQGPLVDFPRTVQCPGCLRGNVAGKSDVSRCVRCNTIYFVDPRGHVVLLKPGSTNGFVKHLEFRIPSDINYLNYVRNFIVGVTREEQVLEEKVSQIEMSLDEALANVVEHAYLYDCHQEIQVQVTFFPDRLEILIRDHGRAFNFAGTPMPDIKEHIEQRRVGGLGRYLMKTLMDEVEYRSDSVTNELRMVKRF
jgi:serine/threonine-protein kinase RsbW